MANIKSIGGNPIVLDASGIASGAVTPDKLAASASFDGITAGAALGITGNGPTESAAWLQRVSASDGPTTIRSIHGNTIVQGGELVSVNMTGIETTGFNQWDEEWENGLLDANGESVSNGQYIRSTNFIPVFPSTQYSATKPTAPAFYVCFYDADKAFISPRVYGGAGSTTYAFETPSNARYIKFATGGSTTPVTTYNHDICINLKWSGYRDGEYEPYWSAQRTIPAGTLRSAGSVYDEQTETERIVRVGEVDLGTLTWSKSNTSPAYFNSAVQSDMAPASANSHVGDLTCEGYDANAVNTIITGVKGIGVNTQSRIVVYDPAYADTDAAAFKTAMSGVMAHYALATPTVTPYDQPLNMTYRTEHGGTERVMVPTGENSAPPTLVTAQGYTAESLRDAALSAIAPVENGKASTNYGIGSYLVHAGQLCKVTTAIATGESITIGTNVTATTVMAEVIALTQ